jgi:hypothetical protein
MKKEVFSKEEESQELTSYILLYARPVPRNKGLGPRCLFDKDNGTLLSRQIEEIKSVDGEKEIILCSGLCFDKIYKQKTIDYRIVDNPAFEETGSVEDIRLSVANCCGSKLIFLSDTYLSNKKDLVELRKGSKLVASKKNVSDTKIIVNGNICKQINYSSGKHHFTGSFSVMDKELKLCERYLTKDYNKNRLYTEMLNFIMDMDGKFTILEK